MESRRARDRTKLLLEQASCNPAHVSLARASHMVESNGGAGMCTLTGVLAVLQRDNGEEKRKQ